VVGGCQELIYIRAAKGIAAQQETLLKQLQTVGETAYAQDRAALVDQMKALSQSGQLRYDALLLDELEQVEITRLNSLLNLQPKTRDVVVRLEFDNPDLLLKPDMYADVRIRAQAASEGLVIPSEAVIRSGERNIVFVAKGEGKFSPREVRLGLSLDGGHIQTLTGLSPGDLVVTSGQFLLDSESKLKEAMQKMVQSKTAPAGDTPAAAPDAFFKDMEGDKESDFFKDMEAEPRVKP
jgi:multidrug efflux pump subunit AcrA (membrane-fusion protein)